MISYANRILVLQHTIRSCQNNLDKASRSLESLERFQREIQMAQSDFHDCMQQKKNILRQADAYKIHTKCICRYQDGLDTRLNGIGASSISVTYSAWLIAIAARIIAYRTEIAAQQALIGSYTRSIHDLEEQQRSEQAAAATGSGR